MQVSKAQRIRFLIEWLKKEGYARNQEEIGRLLGSENKSYTSQLVSGRVKNDEFINKLINLDDRINGHWVLTGEGEMLKDGGQLSIVADSTASYTPSKQKLVPYYDVDFVGGFELVCNSQTATPTYFVDFQQYNEGDCWCNVTGHSMEPKIGHGDKMCLREVKRWKEFLPFGEVYAIVTEEFRTVKIVSKSDKPEHFKLVPINPDPEFAPQDIPVSIILKVFRVLGCCKNL